MKGSSSNSFAHVLTDLALRTSSHRARRPCTLCPRGFHVLWRAGMSTACRGAACRFQSAVREPLSHRSFFFGNSNNSVRCNIYLRKSCLFSVLSLVEKGFWVCRITCAFFFHLNNMGWLIALLRDVLWKRFVKKKMFQIQAKGITGFLPGVFRLCVRCLFPISCRVKVI